MSKKAKQQFSEMFDVMQARELLGKYHNQIPEELQLDTQTDSGFFLGLEHKHDVRDYVGKSSETDGHVLIVGNTGSGKSSIFAKSSCQTWKNPFVVLDIKGELSQHYKQLYDRKLVNRPYIIFDPMKGLGCYDPYAMLDKDSDLVESVFEISHAIIPRPFDIREPYWIDMARNVLSAAIIYYFTNNLNFSETMCMLQELSTTDLCKEIMQYGPSEAKWLVKEIHALKPEHRSAIGTDVQEWTLPLAIDPYIRNALSAEKDTARNSVSWKKIATQPQTPNVFLCLSQDRLEQWSGMIRLMFVQLVRELSRRPDKHTSFGRQVEPLLVLLDEFPLMGRVDIMEEALTTLRSKKVTVALILQNLAQMDKVYGSNDRKILVDCCGYKAILNVTEPASERYLSQLIGDTHSVNYSISQSYDPYTEYETCTLQRQPTRKPLVYPEDLATNPNIWLHTPYGTFRTLKKPVR